MIRKRSRAGALGSGLLIAGLLLGALPAPAGIPGAGKIADQLAQTNEEAGRGGPLLIEVNLRIGEGDPVASGTLASHPTGLARLELRSPRGFVERHLLQGNDYRASRDGAMLDSPRPFLPPLFLLQADSGAALQAALASFGISPREAALGLAEDRDCYVLGGRLPRDSRGLERSLPSLWIDLESFVVVRVDSRDGVRFRFGPEALFDGIRAPRWISIEAPGQPVARLDLVRVARANAPAAAFGSEWLVGASP